ncbi:MAG: DUF1499 domain-containing protein [Ghiorsea sp.]
MKTILWLIAGLVVVGLVAYFVMAMKSQKVPERLALKKGVTDTLVPCPDSPNCVCSEEHTSSSEQHFIAPIEGDSKVFQQVKQVVMQQGGVMYDEQDGYFHATFSTSVFRYVDDVELRLDEENSVIHLRSASRIGRSDFGVNRARMESIKAALLLLQG